MAGPKKKVPEVEEDEFLSKREEEIFPLPTYPSKEGDREGPCSYYSAKSRL